MGLVLNVSHPQGCGVSTEERMYREQRDDARAERDAALEEIERLSANNVLLHTDGQQIVNQQLAWRAVAVALMARLVEEVSDPYCPAVIAYNHARNGRFDDALEWAAIPNRAV